MRARAVDSGLKQRFIGAVYEDSDTVFLLSHLRPCPTVDSTLRLTFFFLSGIRQCFIFSCINDDAQIIGSKLDANDDRQIETLHDSSTPQFEPNNPNPDETPIPVA